MRTLRRGQQACASRLGTLLTMTWSSGPALRHHARWQERQSVTSDGTVANAAGVSSGTVANATPQTLPNQANNYDYHGYVDSQSSQYSDSESSSRSSPRRTRRGRRSGTSSRRRWGTGSQDGERASQAAPSEEEEERASRAAPPMKTRKMDAETMIWRCSS